MHSFMERLNSMPMERRLYALMALSAHLAESAQSDRLRRLLSEFDFLQAKLEATDPNMIIIDYDLLPDDTEMEAIQGALRLSAHILAQDKTQLWSSLYGRLFNHQTTTIQTMLSQPPNTLWLRLLTSSLTPPGGPLLRTFRGHTDGIRAVAVVPDRYQAVSASDDGTLRLWDLQTGQCLHIFTGHSDVVSDVDIVSNQYQAISASQDTTLRLWDLQTGQCLHILRGHNKAVSAVAAMSDEDRAISVSWDGTLRLWDLQTGQCLHIFSDHHDFLFYTVASIPKRHQAISCAYKDEGGVRLWDLHR
jgi:WD40 repeat protein